MTCSREIHLHRWRNWENFRWQMFAKNLGLSRGSQCGHGHLIRQSRIRNGLVSIENIEALPGRESAELAADQSEALQRLGMLIQSLKPLLCDREDAAKKPPRVFLTGAVGRAAAI